MANHKSGYGIAVEWRLSLEALVFLMFFSLTSCTFYNCYFKQYFSENLLYRQEKMLRFKLPESEIVFLGDSRCFLGVDPNLIPGSLNYASPAEGYVQTYYKLKHLLEIKSNIKTVILQYDWDSLVRGHMPLDQLYFWRDFIDPLELDLEAHTLIYYQFMYRILATVAPYTANLSRIFQNDRNRHRPQYGIVFSPRPGYSDLNEEKLLLKITENFNKSSGKVEINRLVSKYFLKILNLLNEHNIDIYLIRFPVSKYYYERTEQMMDINAYEETLQTAMRDYKVRKYINYSKLFAKAPCLEYNCKNFHDFDHLNTAGAKRVSRLLAGELVN